MRQNNEELSQAKGTILADTTQGRQIGQNGDSDMAEQNLQDMYTAQHQLVEVQKFIQSCQKDPIIKEYTQNIDLSMFEIFICFW